eukprot:TRINITY_DN41240_c0_g1_i1.p1 TRINITY_DN41240_c0_g1~~TRINITY_DN41240_c0_g1_i1.p1  ORF type:complete len:226 (+),score=44.53 TRINITY_DN41240_c0_g1_i1:53-730(+)
MSQPSLVSLSLFRRDGAEPIRLFKMYDLSFLPFFRRLAAEAMVMPSIDHYSLEFVRATPVGARRSMEKMENLPFVCHTWVDPKSRVGAAAIVHEAYPPRVAFALLCEAVATLCAPALRERWEKSSAHSELDCPEIEKLFEQYQKPQDMDDKLEKIQGELLEVCDIVKQSMEDLLRRGEALDSLAEKSKGLSEMSDVFKRRAERNNSTCKWLRDMFMPIPDAILTE